MTRLPFETASATTSLSFPHWVLFGIVMLCCIIGGCVMDALAFLLVSPPIFYPIVTRIGCDPII
ncbi:TRAP transporter large permease subunit [Syntrophorhabdus aromaticivorans]|uniref:TRAP transporter large permease subunit n=1 Tax=Syntrophorhabdus aromaticivorans TaxID=328301 RepID=UPI0018DD7937